MRKILFRIIAKNVDYSNRRQRLGSTLNTEKAMASHSSTLAWKTPWAEEPGGLQSMG